jgi:hypothetical protein
MPERSEFEQLGSASRCALSAGALGHVPECESPCGRVILRHSGPPGPAVARPEDRLRVAASRNPDFCMELLGSPFSSG